MPDESGAVTPEFSAEVESIEAVPEIFRQFYEEKDNKFVLQEISPLKNAMNHAKTEREQARRRAAELEKKSKAYEGIDVEEYLRLKQEAEEREHADAEKKGDFEKIKSKIAAEREAEKQAYESEIQALRTQFDEAIVGRQIADALGAAGATEEGRRLLSLELRERLKMVEVDGKRIPLVVDADGDPLTDGAGNNINAEQYAKTEFPKLYPSLIQASGTSGGGAPTNGGGGAGRGYSTDAIAKMSAGEKATLMETNPEAWAAYLNSM